MRALELCVVVALALSACGKDADSQVEWHGQRDYDLTLYNTAGDRILEVEVRYIGKRNAPAGGAGQSVQADFYRMHWRNRSLYPVSIEAINYDLEKGSLFSADKKGQYDIRADYGKTTLAPDEELDDEDSWVWSRGHKNVLHRVFNLTVNSERIKMDLPLVYRDF